VQANINIDGAQFMQVNYNPAAGGGPGGQQQQIAVKARQAVTVSSGPGGHQMVTVPVTMVTGGGHQPGTSATTVNLGSLQPGQAVVRPVTAVAGTTASVVIPASDSFKTDIQDFKGGIKFERGRKIKHILPTGGEIAQ